MLVGCGFEKSQNSAFLRFLTGDVVRPKPVPGLFEGVLDYIGEALAQDPRFVLYLLALLIALYLHFALSVDLSPPIQYISFIALEKRLQPNQGFPLLGWLIFRHLLSLSGPLSEHFLDFGVIDADKERECPLFDQLSVLHFLEELREGKRQSSMDNVAEFLIGHHSLVVTCIHSLHSSSAFGCWDSARWCFPFHVACIWVN